MKILISELMNQKPKRSAWHSARPYTNDAGYILKAGTTQGISRGNDDGTRAMLLLLVLATLVRSPIDKLQ